jgi:hypothetical protein
MATATLHPPESAFLSNRSWCVIDSQLVALPCVDCTNGERRGCMTRLSVEWLPAQVPDFDPLESVWNHLK